MISKFTCHKLGLLLIFDLKWLIYKLTELVSNLLILRKLAKFHK